MGKRYRVEIKYPVSKKEVFLAADLENAELTECEHVNKSAHIPDHLTAVRFKDWGNGPVLVPNHWLEEIIEEPMSAEEYVKTSPGGSVEKEVMRLKRLWEVAAFKAGEANNELRHRETESWEEYIEKNLFNPSECEKNLSSHAWKACNKSRGFTD